MGVTSSHLCPMDRQCTEQVDISYFSGPVLMNRKTDWGGRGGDAAVQELGCKHIVGHLEVPPPHNTLQPAGQTGGGLYKDRRSPGGDGGEMSLRLGNPLS